MIFDISDFSKLNNEGKLAYLHSCECLGYEHESFVYLTTCKSHSKIYIGVCNSSDLQYRRLYLGSGSHLLNEIRDLGRENFNKKVIIHCNSVSETYDLEKLIINEEFLCWLTDKNLANNRTVGGAFGVYDPVFGNISRTPENRKKSFEVCEKMIENGTHPFLNMKNNWSSSYQNNLVLQNKNNFQKAEVKQKALENSIRTNKNLSSTGNHYFQSSKNRKESVEGLRKYIKETNGGWSAARNSFEESWLTPEAKICWVNAEKVIYYLNTFQVPTHILCKYFNTNSDTSIRNIKKKLESGWIPEKDNDWVEFKNSNLNFVLDPVLDINAYRGPWSNGNATQKSKQYWAYQARSVEDLFNRGEQLKKSKHYINPLTFEFHLRSLKKGIEFCNSAKFDMFEKLYRKSHEDNK